MPRTVTKQVFQFDELSDKAKEKARDWFRELADQDNSFAESVLEEAERFGEMLGISIARARQSREPAIYWSGFSSQGDGASFDASYAYKAGGPAAIRGEVGDDPRLFRIADELEALQAAHGYRLTATVKQSGHYMHAYCTDIDVAFSDGEDTDTAPSSEVEAELVQLLRDFMNWIYRQLESAYDGEMEDESIAENIRANEYEFEADGSRTRD